jgi:hypothetical protein
VIKWDLKRRPIYEFRCRDEVKRRDVWECDGWVCDLEDIGAPSIFNVIRSDTVLLRMLPTFDFVTPRIYLSHPVTTGSSSQLLSFDRESGPVQVNKILRGRRLLRNLNTYNKYYSTFPEYQISTLHYQLLHHGYICLTLQQQGRLPNSSDSTESLDTYKSTRFWEDSVYSEISQHL